ncbi:MAG: hypothetical protein ACREDR_19835, partial [Blastocatellia bacterium]
PNTKVSDWVITAPQLPLPSNLIGTFTQNITVKVDGFQLTTGVVNRTVTVASPANVSITWP